MKFLQECSLLKIEDILPFFPDFVTIDHFKVTDTLSPSPVYIESVLLSYVTYITHTHTHKQTQDAICTSLSEYNAHIDDLKTEMQGATDSAKNIRADIQDIRNK